MLFKDGGLAAEFLKAPMELRTVIHDLDDAMVEWGLGQVTVTDVGRDPSFYDDGTPWSWHFVFSAVDLRTKHLRPVKKLLVRDWLKKRCADDARFGVVLELDAKRGEHLHVQFRDAGRKAEWLAKHGARTV